MEWFCNVICESKKLCPNAVLEKLAKHNVNDLKFILARPYHFQILILHEDFITWLSEFSKEDHNDLNVMLLKCTSKLYLPLYARVVFKHMASNLETFLQKKLSKHPDNEYLQYNISIVFKDLAKYPENEYLLRTTTTNEPFGMIVSPNHPHFNWNEIFETATSLQELGLKLRKLIVSIFNSHCSQLHNVFLKWAQQETIRKDEHVLQKNSLCHILQLILSAPQNVHHFEVCKFLSTLVFRISALFEKEEKATCLFPLIRVFPKNLVQLLFFPRSYWCDYNPSSDSNCRVTSKHYTSLWNHLLPQWRCCYVCIKNKYGAKGQCPRFAMNEVDQFPLCKDHHKNHYSKPLIYMRPYATAVDLFADASNDFYHTPHIATLRYPHSKRVINAMYSRMSGTEYNNVPKGFYLPVLRYENLYFDAATSNAFCGKFFFYEPHSNVFLRLRSAVFFTSKIHAFLELQTKVLGRNVPLKDLVQKKMLKLIMQYYDAFMKQQQCVILSGKDQDEILTDFMKYRFCQLHMSVTDVVENPWYAMIMPLFFPSHVAFGIQKGGKGKLDFLDQDICELAKKLNIDNVILQHEIGGRDCVSEILHTGTNVNSDLFMISDVTLNPQNFKYGDNLDETYIRQTVPKVWFPANSGAVYVNSGGEAKLIPLSLENFSEAITFWPYQHTGPNSPPPSCGINDAESHEWFSSRSDDIEPIANPYFPGVSTIATTQSNDSFVLYQQKPEVEDAIREHYEYKFN